MSQLKLLYRKIIIKSNEVFSILPDYILFFITKKENSDRKAIVFVGTILHGRIARMAKWLSKNDNYELILICSKSGFSKKFSNPVFDEIYTYRNEWHLKSILKKRDGLKVIFHSFGPPFQAAKVVVDNVKLGKVIFDFQDLLITNFGLNPPFSYMKKEIVREEYVLKNVDGLVCHSLELQTAKKYYGKIQAKKLYFPNYTDNDLFYLKSNTKNKNDELHIVYVGGIMSAYRDKDYFGGLQIHWLVEKLNSQKIHFHVYPSPSLLKEHIVDFVEFDKKMEYFHLHQSVSQSQLSQELSKYDFGVLPFFHRTNKRLDDKRFYSTTLKMFNYFEAGLPIIIGEDVRFQNFLGRKFGGGVEAKWEDFDDLKGLLSKFDYKELTDSIKKSREDLSLKNKIGMLLSFYKEL